MNIEIFSVLDAAAKRYMDPFCAPTIEFAIRGFKEACITDGHQFAKFPEDYVLYHVGSFDPELGEIGPVTLAKVAMAISYTNEYKGPHRVEDPDKPDSQYAGGGVA